MFQQPKLLTTLRGYDAPQLQADLLAGVTVAMVAIPLSLAIAIASGATPAQGLVTAVIAGFLISALGGSRVQIGGPTGAFIVVVAGVIAAHGIDGLVAATFIAGLLLVLAGLLRAGRLMALVPEGVVNGFTIGIAAIIATSQLKDLFGLQVPHEPADVLEKVPALWDARHTLDPAALFVGLATAALIVLLRRLAPRLPGLILAIALGSALAALFPAVTTLGDRFGELPSALPAPRLPDLSRVVELLPAALVIAFLAGVESLLSAAVADRLIRGNFRPDAELVAQGVANLGSALFGGLPCHGGHRAHRDQRARGRTHAGGRHGPCRDRAPRDAVRRAAGFASRHAGAGRAPDRHGLEHERAAQVARLRAGGEGGAAPPRAHHGAHPACGPYRGHHRGRGPWARAAPPRAQDLRQAADGHPASR
jgi:SulP family sulfate permease